MDNPSLTPFGAPVGGLPFVDTFGELPWGHTLVDAFFQLQGLISLRALLFGPHLVDPIPDPRCGPHLGVPIDGPPWGDHPLVDTLARTLLIDPLGDDTWRTLLGRPPFGTSLCGPRLEYPHEAPN
jgi:hypothetical protein